MDGSDPSKSGTREKYNGAPIPIDFEPDAGITTITLRAYTEKAGLWDSVVATYINEYSKEGPGPGPGPKPVTTKYIIKLDLDGGEVDGRNGVISEQYDEGTVITMPEPSKEGYSFLYWEDNKGAREKAKQWYTVKVTCYVCAYAQNGVYKRIRVTVK